MAWSSLTLLCGCLLSEQLAAPGARMSWERRGPRWQHADPDLRHKVVWRPSAQLVTGAVVTTSATHSLQWLALLHLPGLALLHGTPALQHLWSPTKATHAADGERGGGNPHTQAQPDQSWLVDQHNMEPLRVQSLHPMFHRSSCCNWRPENKTTALAQASCTDNSPTAGTIPKPRATHRSTCNRCTHGCRHNHC